MLASTTQADIAASLGHFEGRTRRCRRPSCRWRGGDEDLLLSIYVRYQRAWVLGERGEWVTALDETRSMIEILHHGGHVLGELHRTALLGRILLVMAGGWRACAG